MQWESPVLPPAPTDATWSRARVVSNADANEDLLTAYERVDAEHGMNGPKSEEEMIRKRIERI